MSVSTLEPTRAAQALGRSPIPALRMLSIEETGASVVIHGNVTSYYLKQMAQETVIPVLEGRELRNRVIVERIRTEPNF